MGRPMKNRTALYLIFFVICTAAAGYFINQFSISSDSVNGKAFNDSIIEVFSEDYRGISFENEITLDIAISTSKSTGTGVGTNEVIGWGLVRSNNNQPPRVDAPSKQLLEKYQGIYIGDTNSKSVYLTFDEGYENGYTGKILDTLRDNNAKAAFFITGPYLKNNQDLVRRMVEEGHIVGNHTVHHPSLPSIDDEKIEAEVTSLDRAFSEKFNRNMTFLRPPKGEFNERTLSATKKLGYRNVFWSFAYDDWDKNRQRGADYAYNIVMKNLHNGAVLLLHAVSKDNAEALDRILKGIRQQGYEIKPIDTIK